MENSVLMSGQNENCQNFVESIRVHLKVKIYKDMTMSYIKHTCVHSCRPSDECTNICLVLTHVCICRHFESLRSTATKTYRCVYIYIFAYTFSHINVEFGEIFLYVSNCLHVVTSVYQFLCHAFAMCRAKHLR